MSRTPLLLLVALLVGCPSADDDDMEPFDCTLGLITPDGAWHDIDGAGATRAELIFGFQGFLWVDAALRGDADAPEVANLTLRITIEGFDPFGRVIPAVRFTGGQSETVAVRLDNSEGPGLYEGHAAELIARLDAPGQQALCEADLLLVDDDPCIDTDGGEPICPGDDDDSADPGDDDDSADPGDDDDSADGAR